MASTFFAGGGKDHHHPPSRHHKMSPHSSFKKAWPASPHHQPPPAPATPSCVQGDHHQVDDAVPMCVCAPATHAGSFKCRLHRVGSHGHSAPAAPPSPGSASSTRTVEAV